jgi:hypothetical protein
MDGEAHVKELKIVIKVPLPDDATEEDAVTLVKLIERFALTSQPVLASVLSPYVTPKVFGQVTKHKLRQLS